MTAKLKRGWPVHRTTHIAIGLGIILGVVGVALLVVRLRDRAEPPVSAGQSQTIQADDLSVTMQLDDSLLGSRAITVLIRDAAGQPVDVGSVRLRFAMAEMNMGTREADAQPVSRGRFEARGPFFVMAGRWTVEALITREGRAPQQASFAFALAAPGEASGPLNPLSADAPTLAAGRLLYQANCAVCHGAAGRGDGPAALGLTPRPGDFTQHMLPGTHTDGQVFLWIRDGFPSSAMPAWGQRFREEQLWQLVTYLRTFGQPVAANPSAPATAAPSQAQPTPASVSEALPPLVFTRQGNLWRSDGSGAAPRQLTHLDAGSYAEHPSLSPDGTQIAFITTTQGPITDTTPLPLPTPATALSLMRADGTALQTLWKPERGVLSSPAWAADGQAVYVSLYDLRSPINAPVPDRLFQVVRLHPQTGERQIALENARDLTFSRDGTRMAFLRWHANLAAFSLNVAVPDGSGEREIIAQSVFPDMFVPRFSPDGHQLIFASSGGPPTDAHGDPLTGAGSAAVQRLLGLLAPPTAEAHGAPWDLWTVQVDRATLHRLTTFHEDTPTAVFSPDGTRIAIMAGGGIYLMQADGSDLRKIDPLGDHGGLDWGGR
jgi:mono/diheme cytochrome c family protein/Tol biopolymer transport system component